MARPLGQLDRAITALTVGPVQERLLMHRQLTDTTAGEYEQQVHVEVSGSAGNIGALIDQDVSWEFPFLHSEPNRLVEFTTPHFTYGLEFTSPPVDGSSSRVYVGLDAHVLRWKYNDENWIVGATVCFGVVSPNTTEAISFSGIIHLSFQGYASYAENADGL